MATESAGDSAVLNYPGGEFEMPVHSATEGAAAVDVSKLLGKAGLTTFDPGFNSTAACSSAITYIDGDAGILRYRGIPIEQLAERSSFLEVSYLLIYGELPTQAQLDSFTSNISRHTLLHEDLKGFFDGFPRDATRCRSCRARSARCPPSTRTASTRSTTTPSSCRRCA